MSEENEPKKPSALMGIVKAVVIIGLLVVVEMVAAAMMIPSAEETEKLARELARASNGDEIIDSEDDEAVMAIDEETLEVELLTDNITRFNPDTDATLNVQFAVYAVLLAAEEPEFTEQFTANQSRIHEQIMLTMHGADTSQLASASLGLIKRQILEKTNRTLGRPLLREVVFTKLNFIER